MTLIGNKGAKQRSKANNLSNPLMNFSANFVINNYKANKKKKN